MIANLNEILYANETLDAGRIMLRKFKAEDAPDILEYGSDAQTLEYLVWEGVKTVEEARASIFDYYWSRPGIFAIELKETGKCIGGIDLRISAEHEKAGFGYVLNRRHWGKGYMTEALSAALGLCFGKLDLNRVEATHYVGNEGSGRVMQKCGMANEGTRKQAEKIKGVFRDVVHYGITKKAWLDSRAR